MSAYYGILMAECKDILEGNGMYNGRLDVLKAKLEYECTKDQDAFLIWIYISLIILLLYSF